MIQKTCFLWVVLFLGYFQSQAQQYSTVKINTSPAIVEKLQHLDIALDHIHSDGISIQADFSRYELQQIKQAGIDFILIRQDAEKEQLPILKDYSRDNETCLTDQFVHIVTPENFELGSMKGHLTYEDLLVELDKMFQLFPDIVSKATPIGDFKTEDGRNIHYVKIGSDLPAGKKPTILYTALHHSREPISMTQMVYFMWYLLENYQENARIRTLLDKIDLYFVPCVNPDGYVYNQLMHPEGGGLWRKNRRPNPDGSFGVDLNRNYGFNWGFDNQGSSNNYLSETYRGEEAFSEPEVKAIRQLCLEHDFRIALNYHSYGNFLIYPFGYTQSKGPDHTLFEEMAAILTKENRFIYGNGIETVQYLTNGDSDDWMYGESVVKDQIFALTPEVGNSDDGFWPGIDRIIPLCKSTLPQNIQAAEFLFNSAFITDLTAPFVQKKNANKWDFKMTKLGFDDGGFQLSLVPLSDNIDFPQKSKFYILDAFNFINDHFDYNVHQDIASGETIRFISEIDNGNIIYEDTIEKVYIAPVEHFSNSGEAVDFVSNGWLSQWGENNFTYLSAPSSLTDSPNGNYLPGSINFFETKNSIQLDDADTIRLSYWAKWDIKSPEDYFQIAVTSDDVNYTPLCGKYSFSSPQKNTLGEPIYSGKQKNWILEMIDLSAYRNESIKLRFSLISTGNETRDGIFLDDIAIYSFNQGMSTSTSLTRELMESVKIFPNPSHDFIQINSPLQTSDPVEFTLYNLIGQRVMQSSFGKTTKIKVNHLPQGMYSYTIRVQNDLIQSGKLTIN